MSSTAFERDCCVLGADILIIFNTNYALSLMGQTACQDDKGENYAKDHLEEVT